MSLLPTAARVRLDFAAASVVTLPFAVYLLVARFVVAPTDDNWSRADPILRLLPRGAATWVVPLVGILAAAAWCWSARPPVEKIRAVLREVALGVLVACGIGGTLRVAGGPRAPPFVPPEESAGPGLLLNMAAGYGEEVLFRLVLLPLLFLALASRVPRPVAVAVAVLATGLAFTLLHEPASASWSPTLFTTRFLLPGCAMSMAALLRSPSFIVAAHCTAHLVVPLAFTG